MPRFERYVAIGDSSTEGWTDPDGAGGLRGWADRLAERIAAIEGRLDYANLGVRGKRTREILDEQLAPALAMRPSAGFWSGSTVMSAVVPRTIERVSRRKPFITDTTMISAPTPMPMATMAR